MRRADKHKTRGAVSNTEGRFQNYTHHSEDYGWYQDTEDCSQPLELTVLPDQAKTIINFNKSPDIPFDRSINPYRGCEHGCIYCFARPTHSYLDLSPGLDFETKLFYKEGAVAKLEQALRKPGYKCQPVVLGINTDAYQPLEKKMLITRRLLQVLLDHQHPVSLLTKSHLILRDMDILKQLAEKNLVSVGVSITSLQQCVKNTLEPRTASPVKRLQVIQRLAANDIPVGVMVAPVIPAITDHEMENIMEQARAVGAVFAGYVLLRLPHELKQVFRDWLEVHYPDRVNHVFSLLEQSHQGKIYNSQWGLRRRGTGPYADMLASRFTKALSRYQYPSSAKALDSSLFNPVLKQGDQMQLGF